MKPSTDRRPDGAAAPRSVRSAGVVLGSILALVTLIAIALASVSMLPGFGAAAVADLHVTTEPPHPMTPEKPETREGDARLHASDATSGVRVYVFYDASRERCGECKLHTLRFAFYSFQFRQAGADVFGVVQGLDSEGRAQVDPSIELPWTPVYDLAGELAEYYGVSSRRNHNPTIVVTDADERVLLRAQPRGVDDRVEGQVMTTVLAAARGEATEKSIARVNTRAR